MNADQHGQKVSHEWINTETTELRNPCSSVSFRGSLFGVRFGGFRRPPGQEKPRMNTDQHGQKVSHGWINTENN